MVFSRTLIALVALTLTLPIVSGIQNLTAQTHNIDGLVRELKPEIDKMMLEGEIPSATIALVAQDKIIWQEGFGFTNLWARTPAVPSTVYIIASTFKAMSTYALLQQMDQGKFKLDDAVRDYLSEITIRDEDPDNPVTFRHLLTHTSGIPSFYNAYDPWGDTVPAPISVWLKENLKVENPPLTKVTYSNMAYTLIAHLVEKFSGVPYKEYMQEHIFDVLQMNDTAFSPRPDMHERLALPYMVDEESGGQVAQMGVKSNIWPAGIVYGTITNQANWLIANLNRGVFGEKRLIKESSFEEMMTRQYDQFAGAVSNERWLNETTGYGLTWWISEREDEKLFAHSGSVRGYTAFLVGNLNQKTGFTILTNGNRAHGHLYILALKALDLMQKYKSAN